MKLLITGGAGFMGSDFVRYWSDKHSKDTLIILDKLTYAGNLENLSQVRNKPKFEFVKGDICDEKLVDELMQGVDIIVHFAAESHVDRSILDPSPFIITNIVGTAVLLKNALKHKVKRFHHISTDEVFGSLPLKSKNRFKESTPYDPSSPYAASKAAADHLVRSFYKTHALPITISNSSNNFGPYQFPEKFIPLTITNALENSQVPIYGDGLYVRDWLFVRDHSRAIESIILRGGLGETYLLSTSNEHPNIETAKKILDILEKDYSLIQHVKDRPGHDRRYALDATKIKKELGWRPQFNNFERALKETIDWYKENRGWWRRIKNKEYLKYYEQQYTTR